MPDREKVISEFVERIEATLGTDSEWVNMPLDLVQYALHFLKDQEPLKPHKSDAYASMWLCGACNGVVALKEPYNDDWYITCEYCPHCGRKVNWDA